MTKDFVEDRMVENLEKDYELGELTTLNEYDLTKWPVTAACSTTKRNFDGLVANCRV